MGRLFSFACLVFTALVAAAESYPEGFYPFEESPARAPPKVRKPPYAQTDIDCPGAYQPSGAQGFVQSLENLCGDLNKGYIPRNPMGHNFDGQAYPFNLIRNKTLDFFSSTLPFLRDDKNIPKVAKYDDFDIVDRMDIQISTKHRGKRDTETRQGKALCQKNYGVVCTLYNIFNGRHVSPQDRVDDPDLTTTLNSANIHRKQDFAEDPVTPCPSAAEYVTPVYAKNYQGVWKYVVQIPYEGYFTQTVEITKCLKKKCHFITGSCLISPRWLSLLVAELFYPNAKLTPNPGQSTHKLNPPARIKRQVESTSRHCDGHDETGCFQVRLYYDWFLVPGSCKCWKQEFFTNYAKGSQSRQ